MHGMNLQVIVSPDGTILRNQANTYRARHADRPVDGTYRLRAADHQSSC
jgi:hypothetical protein